MAKKPPASGIEPSGHDEVMDPGTAVERSSAPQNPGLAPEHLRVTDLDEKEAKGMERRIAGFFLLSIIGSVFAAIAYVVFPIIPGDMSSVRLNNLMVGLGLSAALLGVGIGAVQWAKALMHGHELVEERHPTRGTEEARQAASRPTKNQDSPDALWSGTR